MVSKFVVFSCLLAVAFCAPADEPVAIVSQDADISPDGSFHWSFESADGSKQEQVGVPHEVNHTVVEAVHGSSQWVDPEGGKHEVTYVADENGVQVQGADVPVAPEVPAQIARALEYIATHPQPAEKAH